jgi:hypothetical protein
MKCKLLPISMQVVSKGQKANNQTNTNDYRKDGIEGNKMVCVCWWMFSWRHFCVKKPDYWHLACVQSEFRWMELNREQIWWNPNPIPSTALSFGKRACAGRHKKECEMVKNKSLRANDMQGHSLALPFTISVILNKFLNYPETQFPHL